MRRLILLACTILAPPAAAECKLLAVAVLPVTSAGAPFVFDAQINGKPARLSFDTGDTSTALDIDSAERLGVDMHLSDRPYYGMGGAQRAYYGRIGSLLFGGIRARDYLTLGLHLQPQGGPTGVDGNAAMDMMLAYDIDVDAPGKHIVVYSPEGDCSRPTVSLAPPLFATPLALIQHDRQADVDVTVDGHPLRAMLSTGAPHSYMFRKAAEAMGVDLSGLSATGHTVRRGIGVRDIAVMPHVFASLQVGGVHLTNVTIDILDQAGMGADMQRTGSRLDQGDLALGHQMTLGADFMSKVHVWISHSSGRLIMQYPPQPSVLPQ